MRPAYFWNALEEADGLVTSRTPAYTNAFGCVATICATRPKRYVKGLELNPSENNHRTTCVSVPIKWALGRPSPSHPLSANKSTAPLLPRGDSGANIYGVPPRPPRTRGCIAIPDSTRVVANVDVRGGERASRESLAQRRFCLGDQKAGVATLASGCGVDMSTRGDDVCAWCEQCAERESGMAEVPSPWCGVHAVQFENTPDGTCGVVSRRARGAC